jgi:hypothetical protein
MALVYVSQRYHLLETELEFWGYELVREGGFSSWDDRVALAPLTGLVQIRGEKEQGELRLTFSISELWVLGNVAGRHQAQGCSLVHYHYHGQAGPRRIRWCLDEARHPKNPSHVHRFDHPEGEEPDRHPAVTAEDALQMFEQRVFEMIQAGLLP